MTELMGIVCIGLDSVILGAMCPQWMIFSFVNHVKQTDLCVTHCGNALLDRLLHQSHHTTVKTL